MIFERLYGIYSSTFTETIGKDSNVGIENPRLDILQDYFDFDNFYQIILGKHIKVFEYFDIGSFSAEDLFNPHNSAITLHNSCGIFGFIIIPILVFASLKILINNSVSKGIFFLSILLRGSTDSILIATGVSAFIIYHLYLILINH